MAQQVLPSGADFSLQSVFDDVITELRDKLAPEDFAIITKNPSPSAVKEAIEEAIQKRGKAHDSKSGKLIYGSLDMILHWLDRNSGAIDMVVQSSPQVFGLSLTGLIWGGLRFFIVAAKDLSNTFDVITEVFEQVNGSIPIWDAYADLWGSSDARGRELVEIPLKQMQVTLVRFFLAAIKILDRSIFKSATRLRSAYKSLRDHFIDYQKEIQQLNNRIDRGAIIMSQREVHDMRPEVRQTYVLIKQLDAKMQLLFSPSIGGVTTQQWARRNDLPQKLSFRFRGRDNELTAISEMLTSGPSNKPGRCALWGIPGVGKSQLALKYGEERFQEEYYSLCLWCSGTTVEKLTEGLFDILRRVNPQAAVDPDPSNRLRAVRTWLEDSATAGCRRWLLVVDNVTTNVLDFLDHNLPNLNVSGDILFTTRLKAIAHSLVTLSPAMCINVRELSVDDCVELLLAAANITTDKETSWREAKDFVKKVGCLPLAVEHAGAYVSELDGGIEVLGEGLDESGYSEVLEWDNRSLKYEQQSISPLFTAILKEVDSTSVESGRFLRLLCFLDTENISLDVLADGARAMMERIKDLPSSNATKSAKAKRSVAQRIRAKLGRSRLSGSSTTTKSGFNPYRISDECHSLCSQLIQPKTRNQMADVLKNFSLACRTKASLTIHDLTRDVIIQHTRNETSPDILSLGVQLISEALLAVGDPASPTLWPHFKSLVPHLQCLMSHAKLPEYLNEQLCGAANNAGLYLSKSGLYAGAEDLYKRALAGREKALGGDHPDTLTTMNDLATLYNTQGKYDNAEELFKRALAGNEKALGRNHSSTLATVSNLAGLYESQGKYDYAEELFKRALAGEEEALGHDHPNTLMTIHNLAILYESQGKYDNAEELYERAHAGYENALGRDHPDTLTTVSNLAGIYKSQGKYHNAKELYERALAGKEKVLGCNHPSTLVTVSNFAGLYESQGKYDYAEELYKRALAGDEEALGRDHPDTLVTVSNLAGLYESQGKFHDAKELYERALAGKEKALGCDHPSTLTTVHNLAFLYKSQGKYNNAEELYKRTLAAEEKALGCDHPFTLTTVHNVAGLYALQGKYDSAEELYKRALAGREQALGRDHPDTLKTVHNVAGLYELQGKYDSAEELYKRALAGREQALGRDHPDTLKTVNSLAALYQLQGKDNKAEELQKHSLVNGEKTAPLNST